LPRSVPRFIAYNAVDLSTLASNGLDSGRCEHDTEEKRNTQKNEGKIISVIRGAPANIFSIEVAWSSDPKKIHVYFFSFQKNYQKKLRSENQDDRARKPDKKATTRR
jgi:hypothetical protein